MGAKNYLMSPLRNWFLLYFFNSESWSDILINQFIKTIVWLFPLWILIQFKFKEVFFESIGLNSWSWKHAKNAFLIGMSWGFFNFIITVVGVHFNFEKINFALNFNSWIGAVIFAPIVEEIFFRGFLLKKAQLIWGDYYGNIITSICFAMIHWPNWILFNKFSVFSSLYLFIFSIICGLIVQNSKGKIWGSMLFHSINNYVASL